MGNPASRPEFRHTCPTCNRPVRPGYKFCEVCGTKIPELFTCSKCGTQFIHPEKFCDLCGAPVILKEIPGPHADEIPEPDAEEIPEPAEEETPEHYGDEIQEPDTDEVPEDNNEENIEPAEDETPHHYKTEIQEPDTDELLEKYGKEFGEDETLESCHTPKPPSPTKHKAKKPVTVPAPPARGSSETVDDVLFLSPGKPEAPAKRPVNKTRIIGGCIVLTAIIAAVYFIGLPMLTDKGGLSAHSNPPAAEITPKPEPAIVTTPTPPSRALVPLPTQLIPSGQKIYFQVQKNPVTSKISVIFTGSAGEGSIISADIKVTHTDRSVTTGIIMPLKGVTEITLDGSKETDRVEIIAKMSSGETYRVYDDLVPFMRY
jgi:hypothetical protein